MITAKQTLLTALLVIGAALLASAPAHAEQYLIITRGNGFSAAFDGAVESAGGKVDFKMNAIVADAPLAHFRRTLAKLIDAERGQSQPAAA